jgi:hypothetical protein
LPPTDEAAGAVEVLLEPVTVPLEPLETVPAVLAVELTAVAQALFEGAEDP